MSVVPSLYVNGTLLRRSSGRWGHRCCASQLPSSACWSGAFLRRHYTIVPLDRISTSPSPNLQQRAVEQLNHLAPPTGDSALSGDSGTVLRNEDRTWYDRGISLENKDFIAEAEEAYQRSWAALHDLPGGPHVDEVPEEVDEVTQEVIRPRKTVWTAPFGETLISTRNVAYSWRGLEGELTFLQKKALQSRGEGPPADEFAQLNLKKARQLAAVLEAPEMPLLEKAVEVEQMLVSEFFPHRLALERRIAEEVMAVFFHASLQQRLLGEPTRGSVSEASESEKELNGVPTTSLPGVTSPPAAHREVSSIAPLEGSGSPPGVGGFTLHSMPFLPVMRQLYTHTKRCYVAPSAQMIEHYMVTLSGLAACRARNAVEPEGNTDPSVKPEEEVLFHLSLRLLFDADRYVLLPTRTTLTAFILICRHLNRMIFALAQVKHAVVDLCIPLDAGMMAALIRGFTHCGQLEESIVLLARMQQIPVSTELLNASVEALALSQEPVAAFSLYEAAFRRSAASPRPCVPNAETFTLLLLSMEQTEQWGRVRWIAAEMKRHRIKGSEPCLNLLLKGLLKEDLQQNAVELYSMMRRKGVNVWPALEAAVQQYGRTAGATSRNLRSIGSRNKVKITSER